MDMVGFQQAVYGKIKSDFENIQQKMSIRDVHFIPISALKGDNVVDLSTNMNWYTGQSLLDTLETIPIASDFNRFDPRFPVQYIIRPNSSDYHDYRGYAGRIEGGLFHKGDHVKILPSNLTSRIKSIDTFKDSHNDAFSPQSVTITLEDDIDISRGNMIVHQDNLPHVGQDIELMMCWLNEKPMVPGGKYLLRHTSNEARSIIKEIEYKINISTLENDYIDKVVKMNDIARIKIRSSKPLFYDSYKRNRITGSLVLIDEGTNETVGAGMID
jgi:sulfate adenylyltransferase subunit 1